MNPVYDVADMAGKTAKLLQTLLPKGYGFIISIVEVPDNDNVGVMFKSATASNLHMNTAAQVMTEQLKDLLAKMEPDVKHRDN